MVTTPAPSPILAMARRAAALRAEGRDIVDLTLGEPDFAPPLHVIEAARAAAGRPLGYAPANGLPDLREAIRRDVLTTHGLTYGADQIAVGCGAKQVIFNAFLASLSPGDEVVIPAPYWASYPDMVRMCGGVPVIVPVAARPGFRLQPEELARALSPRTRWVILNAPGNPSGVTYTAGELEDFASVLRPWPDALILSDDIYAHIRYVATPHHTLAAVAPDLSARILLVDGVSKAFAMTGWRVGWGCGPVSLIHRITAVQSQNCTQTGTLNQLAAVAALDGPREILVERRAIYRQRRDAALSVLRASPDLAVAAPDGAFYLLVQVRDLADDTTLALQLLDAGVAVVPGSAFGATGHLRLSFATEAATLIEGCQRLRSALGARALSGAA